MTAQTGATTSFAPFVAIGHAFRRFGAFFIEHSDAMRCKREAERLFAMSDEELARKGLARDRIVHHAFRHYLAS